MWRSILAVILAPAIVAAQTAQTEGVPAVQSQPCPPAFSAKKPNLPTYRQYTYYDKIRRGREEDAAVQFMVAGDVTTPQSGARGIVPLSLELQPSEGLTIKNLRYPKVTAKQVKFQKEPLKVARLTDIHFKIRADQNAALGPRVLKGRLTYQLIPHDGSTPGAVQTMDVEIPITVVEHGAKVKRAAYPYQHMPVAFVVVLIVCAPLLIVAGVAIAPIMIACLATSRCPD